MKIDDVVITKIILRISWEQSINLAIYNVWYCHYCYLIINQYIITRAVSKIYLIGAFLFPKKTNKLKKGN